MFDAALVVILALGLTVYTLVNAVSDPGDRHGVQPFLRGVLLIWFAIALATLVLVGLGGFQHGDSSTLIFVLGILAGLSVIGRGVAHLRGSDA